MKHTPGPWKYEATNADTLNDYTRTIFATIGETVAHVETNDDDGNPTEKGEANARLIAAAPELLAACRLVVESGPIANADPNTWAIVKAAIARAEGK